MKVSILGKERYFDGLLIDNLELIRKAVRLKWDGVFYVGGYEGDGKSVFASQLAIYYDKTYCLDRCVFTPKQFVEAVNNAEPFQAIVYDEAQDAFESTAKDKSARIVKSLMTRIRKKNLFIFIVAPDFWRINKYMFIHRSRAFIRIYSNGLERGYFEYYNRTKKHELKIRGQRNEHLCVPPNFRGRFTKWFPLDEDAYDEKKEIATQEVDEDNKKSDEKYYRYLEAFISLERYTNEEKAKVLGMSVRNYYRIVEKTKANRERDGVTNTKQLTKLPKINLK